MIGMMKKKDKDAILMAFAVGLPTNIKLKLGIISAVIDNIQDAMGTNRRHFTSTT